MNRGGKMTDYKQMYYKLSGEVANVIEKLQDIQKTAEEMYLSHEEPDNVSDEKFQE